jgi:hypothetical protein
MIVSPARQIIHIFRKDIRHLRYDILIVCGLVALYTTWNVQQAHAWWLDRTVGHEFSPLIPLIVVAWAYLLARVIQSEALPGDRQFWLTRPYSRASLLASKILFAMLFVNLPMLISDIVTLRANGFPAASHIGALAWKQMLFTVMIVLPPFALASMTRRLGELILASLGLGVVILIEESYAAGFAYGWGARWSHSDTWIRSLRLFAVIAAAGMVIVALQYLRRSTLISRVIAASVAALVWTTWALPPSRAEFAMEPRDGQPIGDTSWLHVEFAHCENCVASNREDDDFARIALPIEVTGVPEGTTVEIASVTGYVFSSSGTMRLINDVGQPPGGDVQSRNLTIHISYYGAIRNQPVTLKLEPHFRIYKRRAGPIVLKEEASRMPGIGYCAEHLFPGNIICRAPFRWPPTFITARMGDFAVRFDDYFSASPFPTDSPITTVSSYVSRPRLEPAGIDFSSAPDRQFSTSQMLRPLVVFDFAESALTVERSLEWKNIRLADFEK